MRRGEPATAALRTAARAGAGPLRNTAPPARRVVRDSRILGRTVVAASSPRGSSSLHSSIGFLATGYRRDHKWLRWFAGLGVAAMVLLVVEGEITNGLGEIAGVLVLGALLVAVLDRVLRHQRVTIQTLLRCGLRLLPDRADVQRSCTGRSNDLGRDPGVRRARRPSRCSPISASPRSPPSGFGDFTAVDGRRPANRRDRGGARPGVHRHHARSARVDVQVRRTLTRQPTRPPSKR